MAIQQIQGFGAPLVAAPQPPAVAPQGKPAAVSAAADLPVPPTPQQIQAAAKALAQAVEPLVNNLEFSVDAETGKTVVTVVSAGTKEVIRQIPSEEMLAIAHALDRLQGLLLRQKA